MAQLENGVGFSSSSGKTRFSFFNRSLTLNSNSHSNSNSNSIPSESFQKPTLDRSGSLSKFSNSMESVKSVGNSFTGKVKKLCNFFESRKGSSRGSREASLPSSPSKLKPTKSTDSDSRVSSSFSNDIRLPGTEDRIVVYFTSLRGIRRTYEDCYSVRMIFRGFGVWVDERDISMDCAYKKELQSVLGEKKNVSLPQVFIRGKHIGGADVINNLFEVGELAKILEGIPKRKPGFVCESCGDVRFVPCMNCSGSRKIFDEDEGMLKRCLECNENGLIRCPDCGS